jgi:hypothetical protein
VQKLNEQPILLSDHDWVWSVAFTPDDEQLVAGINSIRINVVGVDQTIHAYPTKINTMASILCGTVKRNINNEEWELFVGKDLKYEKTCSNLPENNK